jgi:hypothetical protein
MFFEAAWSMEHGAKSKDKNETNEHSNKRIKKSELISDTRLHDCMTSDL